MCKLSSRLFWELSAPIVGTAMALSFSPFDYHYLAPLALAYLFASWQNVNPRRAFLRGLLFGLGTFGLGVSWVYISIHDMGKASVIESAGLTVAFVTLWALFPAVSGYFSTHLLSIYKKPVHRLLILPIAWTLVEFIRGSWFLNGFPWLLCAYSQLDTPLAGYVPLLGPYGTGFLLTLTAARIAALFSCSKPHWLSISGITLVWILGSFLQTITWTQAIGNPFHVALIQGNIAQDQKWRSENKNQTMELYKSMTGQHWDAEVIIWPETSIPAYLSEINETFLVPLGEQAKQHNSDLIISVPVKNLSKNQRYNTVITLGRHQGMYQKRHLLPFGEFLPWQPFSSFVLNKIKLKLGEFTPGDADQPLLKAAGYPFITSICYEDAFAEANSQHLAQAAYLVNVTNDAWFGHSIEPYQHMQIARMRALETGRYLIRATNTGQTGIVSPEGKIIAQLPLFQTAVLRGEITPMTGMTPFAKWGNNMVMLFLVSLVIATLAIAAFSSPLTNKRL